MSPSVQIFVFHSTWKSFSLQIPAFSSSSSHIFRFVPIKPAEGRQHKQTEFPSILQWAFFDAPPSFTKLCPSVVVFTPFCVIFFWSFTASFFPTVCFLYHFLCVAALLFIVFALFTYFFVFLFESGFKLNPWTTGKEKQKVCKCDLLFIE